MNEYCERQQRLLSNIPDDADGAIITSQVNRMYFTGYNADTGYLLITRGGCAFVTDFRYTEAANAALSGVCPVVEYSKLSESFARLLTDFSAKTLLTESERLTLSDARELEKALAPVQTIQSDALDMAINAMRVNKSASELECIRAAQRVTEETFLRILGSVREGVTERELALELEFDMRRSGAQSVSFDLIVAAGANSSMPHAVPSDYKIKQGDFITFDIGTKVGCYCSDMTRTVALGKASQEQREVYDIVLKAQLAGVEYLTSGGRDCFEADRIARDIIARAGYGEHFGHSLGHGVGLDIHERPNLSPRAKGTLSAGNVVTVEPGIYLPGRFGVRIEDMVYITEDGAVNLTGLDKELIEL